QRDQGGRPGGALEEAGGGGVEVAAAHDGGRTRERKQRFGVTAAGHAAAPAEVARAEAEPLVPPMPVNPPERHEQDDRGGRRGHHQPRHSASRPGEEPDRRELGPDDLTTVHAAQPAPTAYPPGRPARRPAP